MVFKKQPCSIGLECEGVKNCSVLAQKSLSMSDMSWPICTLLARKRNVLEYVRSGSGDGISLHLSKYWC